MAAAKKSHRILIYIKQRELAIQQVATDEPIAAIIVCALVSFLLSISEYFHENTLATVCWIKYHVRDAYTQRDHHFQSPTARASS